MANGTWHTNGAWHTLEASTVLERLGADAHRGLDEKEVRERLARWGPNQMAEKKKTSAIVMFVGQFEDFMVLVLLAATFVSLLLGEVMDAVTILAIVVLNAIFGFVQEYRAERSLAALRRLSAPTARVIRDNRETAVPAQDLVPGDVLLVEAGDRIPADARLLEAASLECVEAALTGESLPVRKRPAVLHEPRLGPGDRSNMLFMGTAVTRGRGRAVVVATGMSTEMGQIAGLIQEAGEEDTPLQVRLEQLGRYLVLGCLLICAVVVATGVARGEPPYRMFLAGVSLAVAAIPEGLPAVVTIALAVGVQRMIRANAIVRRLPAVETLGCATVICSDKTGTLTTNEMTVRTIFAGGRRYEVTGHGYEPRGKFICNGSVVNPASDGDLLETLLVGALCSNARLAKERPGGLWGAVRGAITGRKTNWSIQGDPTEGALVVAAAKGGLDPGELGKIYRRRAEIPFESERRRMSVVCSRGRGADLVAVKGAPDTVLQLCTRYQEGGRPLPLTGALRQAILAVNEEMASRAQRVLAVAERHVTGLPSEPDPAQVEKDLVFLGLVGMIDPPRPEAKTAIARCREAGIRPVMITGDHRATAAAIAGELDLMPQGGRVLTGDELDGMGEKGLLAVIDETYVFARVSPRHKLAIVRALKKQGHIVAMTGDGVNDAPAVKEADIGVAMGKTGTDVTREASAMVLADDNFATIVAAVEEGRAIYDNIRKFIRYLLSCNVGEVLTMFLAALSGMPMPLVPIQILWVNLVTDGLPAMALGVDPPEKDIMRRPPRPPRESVFARRLSIKIAVRGILIGISTLGVFWLTLGRAGDLDKARTMGFATLVMCQLFHAFDCRSERRSIYEMGLFTNPYLVLAVSISTAMLLVVLYHPLLMPAFKTVPLGLGDWAVVTFAAGFGSIAIGLRRMFLFRKYREPVAEKRRRK